jgi:hypothetical protein
MGNEITNILERDILLGSVWISPFITGHFECVTCSTPFERDTKVAFIRSCMDVANNPSCTLTAGLDSNYNLLLLNETAVGYICKNDYPGSTGTIGYSVRLDLPIPALGSYIPSFYIRIYFDIFFHKKEVLYFPPCINYHHLIN